MKKFSAILAVVIAIGGSWSAYNYYSQKAACATCDRELREDEEREDAPKEKEEAKGMRQLFAAMRNNPETGDIPLVDYYQARVDAKHFAGQGMRGALNLEWEEMGPDNQGGRARAILIDKDNPNKMFAGGVSGGLWVSTNSGASWTRVPGSDEFNSQIISCIAQAENGNIYFGTGEHFGYFGSIPNVTGATGFPGGGIWRSNDGGTTWENIKDAGTSLSDGGTWSFINDMETDKVDGNKIWVCIKGSATVKGLQKLDATTDEFMSQPTIQAGEGQDVECGTDGAIHASLNGKYYRSTDGTNFTLASTPFNNQLDRLEIAVAPSNPSIIYFTGTKPVSGEDLLKGIWRSDDGGSNFNQIAGASVPGTSGQSTTWFPVTQGSYALASLVHPTNPDVFIIGGLDVYRYTPTSGFLQISNWTASIYSSNYVHADIHNFLFRTDNPNAMYVVSDGGINYTSNVTVSEVNWSTKNNGFITTQFYAAAAKNYSGELLGGTQDNGNWMIDFNGNTTRWGLKIKSGDGGDIAVSTINPNLIIAEYVFGDVARSSNNGASFANMLDCNIDYAPAANTSPASCGGDDQPDEGSPFISQFELWEDVNDPNMLTRSKFFLGTTNRLWMTQEALDLSKTPTWFRLNNSAFSAGIGVTALKVTANGETVFVGTDNGVLYRVSGLNQVLSYDAQENFNPDDFGIQVDLVESWSGRYITDIDIDTDNDDNLVVVLGNYGAALNHVYVSTNAMDSAPDFSAKDGTTLPNIPVYSVLFNNDNSNEIIIGTELGVYSTDNGNSANPTWTIEETMPKIPVLKLYRHKLWDASSPTGVVDNVIVAGTYGRGIFRTKTLQVTGTNDLVEITSKSVGLYPNPAQNETTLKMNLMSKSDVVITVYGLNGQQLKQYTMKNQIAGEKTYKIQTSDLANGTYLVNVGGNHFNATQKLVVLR